MAKAKELTSRQKQAIDSKNRLVAMATDLFNDRGYQNTTVQGYLWGRGAVGRRVLHYFPQHDASLAVQQQKTAELMHFIDTESKSKTHLEAILEAFCYIARQQSGGSFELVCNSLCAVLQPADRAG